MASRAASAGTVGATGGGQQAADEEGFGSPPASGGSGDGPPRLRFSGGLTQYEEALEQTRWTHRYWSPAGRIEAAPVVRGQLLHNAAFGLEIDGQSLHRGWCWTGSTDAPPERDGRRHAVVTLEHAVRPVRLRVHTVTDGTPIVARWLEIENTGTVPAALSHVWVWGGRVFPAQLGESFLGAFSKMRTTHGDFAVGHFTSNKHSDEGRFGWRPLDRQTIELGEDSGSSGFGHPIVYLRDGKAGHVFVAQLAWSGNWRMRVEHHDERWNNPDESEDRIHLRLGPWAPAPMRLIEPAERVSTPVVHFGGIAGDLPALVQALHEHQRRSVLPAPPQGGAHLVSFNSFGATGHEFDEEELFRAVDIAADLGAEVFTVDAGWNGPQGKPWQDSLGDWEVGGRLPNGLKPLFDYARQRGLRRGLWCQMEKASLTTPVARERPDWVLARDGRPIGRGFLDLSQPAVARYVETQIARLVEQHELDLFRMDGKPLWDEGGYTVRGGYEENTSWRHSEVMDGIWRRLRERFPHVIWESCSGGGGRTDLQMLARFDYTWVSDFGVLPRSARICNGMLLALPPERIARHTMTLNAYLGGDLPMQLRLSLLTGNPCLGAPWPSPDLRDGAVVEEVRRALDFFKTHVRPMVATCRVYHHTPEIAGLDPEGWCVLEYAAPDARKAIAGLFRLAGAAPAEYRLRFRGLSRATAYRVHFGNTAEAVTVPGRELVAEGLAIHLHSPMTSELVLAEAVA